LDFSYKISRQNRYVFTADILFFPGLPRFVNNTITIAALTSPFCSTVESLPSKQTQKSFQFTAIPLDPLRIVGRIQQGQRAQALVTLPDNTTVAVNIRK
jgi:Tfp pilus assembly protein PilP